MLQANTILQQRHIEKLTRNLCCSVRNEIGIHIDDFITYDQMAEIVDYLRTCDQKDDLFEKCWIEYNRKGSKKKSREYWSKLTEEEKSKVLPHIKAYVASRDLNFQKDFERYLRDRIFMDIVYKNNSVIYDPTRNKENEYSPQTSPLIAWNEYYKCYMYLGYFDGHISDGYNDSERPNGARITLNNGRGTIVWDAQALIWHKI